MKRQDNHSVRPGETAMGLIDNDNLEELAALDQLPVPIRRAVDLAAIGISARSILEVYREGWPDHVIIREIQKADERVAVESGTMPGSFWRGRSLVLKPSGELDTAAAKTVRRPGRRQVPRSARRFGRSPGSY